MRRGGHLTGFPCRAMSADFAMSITLREGRLAQKDVGVSCECDDFVIGCRIGGIRDGGAVAFGAESEPADVMPRRCEAYRRLADPQGCRRIVHRDRKHIGEKVAAFTGEHVGEIA